MLTQIIRNGKLRSIRAPLEIKEQICKVVENSGFKTLGFLAMFLFGVVVLEKNMCEGYPVLGVNSILEQYPLEGPVLYTTPNYDLSVWYKFIK